MSWTILPDGWLLDAAIARLSLAARGLLASLATWLNGQPDPNGTIPEDTLEILGRGADPAEARRIIDAELVPDHLEPIDGGWLLVPRHPYIMAAAERARKAADQLERSRAGGKASVQGAERTEHGHFAKRDQPAVGAASTNRDQPRPTIVSPRLVSSLIVSPRLDSTTTTLPRKIDDDERAGEKADQDEYVRATGILPAPARVSDPRSLADILAGLAPTLTPKEGLQQ